MDDMVMKMFRKISASVACCVSLFAVAGCDVGLGESVDTSAPTLSIEYPPIAAVIKDTFVLYGSCDDDKDVASVSVQVVNTETKEVVDMLNATIDAGGKSWRVDVNPYIEETGKYKYLDGTYQFSASAVDGAGHSSGESSRTFDLDNTAPVFIISKPGVVKSENLKPSAYGSVFTIDGTIADNHTISLMDVKIFDENGNVVSSESYDDGTIGEFFREEEIATAGGTSVTIAQSGNDRYSKLYNDATSKDAEGTARYYAEISLCDNAQVYNEPVSGERSVVSAVINDKGNKTSVVYLYDDVYSELMSAKKGMGLSAADLKDIISGTYSGTADKENVRQILSEKAKDTAASDNDGNRLSFSLNPDANPTYTVNSFAFNFDADATVQSASSGNSLTVTIQAGLDNTNIAPECVKVWIKEFDSRPTDSDEIESQISDLWKTVKNAGETEFTEGEKTGDWLLIYDYSKHNEKGSSVSTETFSATLPAGVIKLEKFYIVAVTGTDVDDVEFSQKQKFGFEGNEAGVPPNPVIETPENLSIVASTAQADLEFTGTAVVKSSSLFVQKLTARLTVTDETTGESVGEATETISCELDSNNRKTWTANEALFFDSADKWHFVPEKLANYSAIAAARESGKMYLYTLTLEAKSSSGHTAETSRSVHVDTTLPAISISSAEPRVELYEPLGNDLKDKYIYLNGTVTIKGSIEEQNLSEVTYDIWASTDLTKELSEADSIFKLAESNATIKAALENAGLDKSLGKVYSISQEFKTSLISNLFATSENRDPMIKVEVVLMAEDNAGNKTTYYASKDPILNGKTDTVDGKAFVIYQETDRPIITLENANSAVSAENQINDKVNLFGTTSNNRLQVSFEDDDTIDTIWVTLYDKDGTVLEDDKVYDLYSNPFKTQIGKSTYTLNYQLPSAEGTYKVRIDAFDSGSDIPADVSGIDSSDHNIRSVQPFLIAIDSGAPQIKVSSPDNESYTNKAGEEGKFSLAGTVSKKLETKIECSVAKADGTEVDSSAYTFEYSIADAKNSSGTYDWTGSIILPSTDDLYTLTLTASDNYSQKSSVDLKLGLDTQKPVWSGDDFKVGGKAFASGANHTWYKSSTLQFEGKFAESGSGIDHVEYSVTKAGETEPVSDSFAPNTDGSFKQNLGEFIAKVTDDAATANKIKFVAVDKAGNASDATEFEIFIDSEVPTVSSELSGSQYSNKSLPITVTGTSEDDSSGVASVELTVTENGKSDVKTTVTASPKTSGGTLDAWTATIPVDFLSTLENKTYAVKASVTDKAGNKSTSKLFSIDVDAEKPTIKNVSLSDGGGTYSVYETSEKIDGADKTVYYIHSGNNFLLSGSVQDSKSGIKSIVVNDGTNDIVSQIDGKDVTALPVTLDLSNYASAGSVTLKITATDNAGNTESQNVLVKIDDIAPKALHAIDAKQKDVFFRIGENDNDDIETLTDLDKDVGGKYAEGTYGNSKTIKIRGTLSDTGSGNSMIYYKVISETDLAGVSEADLQTKLNEKADDFLQNYKTDKTGYFAPGVIASDAKRRVFYTGALKNADGESTSFSTTSGEYKDFVSNLGTLSGSTKSYATVESNYNSVLSGFSTGKNYLILVAVDNVGNAALDLVKVGDTTYSNVSLNVDETTPDASSSVAGLKYTNKKGTMALSGKASDADSGLYSITLKQGTKEIVLKNDATGGTATNENGTLTIEKTDDKDNEWTWTATVNNDKFFAGASGTVSVSLEAKDCAGIGNTKSINVATVIVDEQLDNITLSSPTDADSETAGTQVNGTITLEGTMSDANVLPANAITRIEYKKASDTAWTEASTTTMPNLALSGSYTFKVEGFDTTKLSDNTEYQLRAVGTDSAGNVKESGAVSIKVAQDSDRPKVKINNLTPNGDSFILMYGNNAQVNGIISDDDSTSGNVVKEFYMTENPVTATKNDDGTYSVIETLSDNTTRTAENKVLSSSWKASTGEFTFEPSDKDDGLKHFYILVIDNGGKIFYTTATKAGATAGTTVADTLALPKITVTKAESTAESLNSSVFNYSADGKNPTVELMEGVPYAANEETAAPAKDDKGVAYELSTAEKPTTNATLNSSFKVGGVERRYVKFYFTANDASGVAGITVEFKDEKGKSLKKLATAAKIGSVDTGCEANGTFVGSDNKDTNATWTTDFVDLKDFGDVACQISVSITPYDKAGLAGNGSCNFYVDNMPPKIEKIEPKIDSEVSGDVEISGNASDEGVAGTANIQWLVPDTNQVTAYNAAEDKTAYLNKTSLNWNGGVDSLEKDSTVTSWKFVFDGKYNEGASTPTEFKFKIGNPSLTVYDDEKFAGNNITADGIYTLPIWFKATDALGNTSFETSYKYKHNPDADKPKLEFSYPTKENYKSETDQYAVLGGTIRVTGSAIIPSGKTTVNSIYYQIADADASATFGETDKTRAEATYGLKVVSVYDVINKIRGTTTYSKDSSLSEEFIKGLGFKSKTEIDAWWGIEATGTASWNFKLNEDGKLNPSTGTNDITLRACGVNAEGKFGAWTSGDNEIAIHIDKSAPVITASVNKYGDGKTALGAKPTAEPTSILPYDADMYLKGNWTLVATLLDESGLSGTTPYSVMKGDSSLAAGTGYFVEENVSKEFTNSDGTTTTKTGVRLYIPIPKDLDSAEITVNASDTDHTSTQKFSFKIDETAPTLDKLTGNGLGFDETNESKKFKSIEDSNYRFTISGSSFDSVSGVKNIVFYYMRKNGETGTIAENVVMDPMSWNNAPASKVKMDGTVKAIPFTQGNDTYYLYAKSYSGSATTDTFTSDTAYDAHVRLGGLVYIDGVLRTITGKTGETVTFTPSLSEAKTSVTADFPIAQVIDNSASEKIESYSGDTFTFESGDDGDGMPESFSKSASTWTWDAAIRSNNMPDGPVSLVILAFDNAGNVAGRTINTKISNNAPRIAKVFLGTDLNGDGNYTNSSSIEELVEYDILGAEGTEKSAYELDFTATTTVKNVATPKFKNGIFTIKNGLAVVPEFVGGNGEIGMVLNNAATSKAVVTKGTASTTWYAKTSAGSVVTTTDSENNAVATASKSFTGTVAGTLKGTNASYKMYSYVVAKDDVGSDADSKGMSFTFWDSTEETTQGTSSQNAVLYVKNFKVAQSDSTPPTVVVNPFYWASAEDNSLYGGSKANGHVELEADWTALASDNTTPLTGWDKKGVKGGTYLDSDPKVSGKIRFTGTAYDNYRLGSISFSFGDFKTGQLVAEYKKVGDVMKWVITSSTIGDGYVFAVNDTTLDEDGNKVYHGHYSDTAYFGQAGHKVYWTLDIDTEKISTAADKDVSLTVTAKDAANKETSTTSITAPTVTNGKRTVTDGTTNFPVYVVDVVPYITGIENKVGDAYKKDSSVFGRSATGSYPVYYYSDTQRETFTVNGFNFGSSPSVSVNGGTATTGNTVNVTSAMNSGEVVVTVGGVSSLNNKNNNDAKGSYDAENTSGYDKYKNYYNRQPNNVNNSTLTDDCKVAVWNVKQVVSNKLVRYPNMRVNASGQIAFIYDSGNDKVRAYKDGDDFEIGYSWSQWFDTAVAIDKDGNFYGSSMNGDTAAGGNATYAGADANNLFFANNTKYTDSQYAYDSSNNGLAIESGTYDGTFYGTRVRNPKITTDKNNALYMTYYDSATGQLKFRYGTGAGNGAIMSHVYTQGRRTYNNSSAPNYHIIAGGSDKTFTDYSVVKTDNASRAGEYSAVGATNETTPAAVVVWYSEADQGLYYTYNKTPSDSSGWSNAVEIDDNFVGWYVDLVVDGANGVHIAYYDASNGDLKYAYVQDYTNPAAVKTMTVDSYLSSGTNISISVKKVGSDYVPYISSFMSSFNKTSYTVRTAWITDGSLLKSKTADELKGVDGNDDFTGVWEVMTVPLASTSIPLDYSVGIGIKSNQPILGYGTQNGLETATLK
ncbi:hypothetical protein TRSA_18760 [Treponema saccharophilum]|uniref:Ig-like domain-containing protein n=2 Tax=Treponema saccharophilum TaxID=165 RepID=H7EKS9_9SPIR|nr:hypothetical protein TresaDRAFT_1979 [Treponema saccharophilum DSM 2985]BDC96777.1 hypothetical protein TRSA_18760 [Treponema saccharophilum]